MRESACSACTALFVSVAIGASVRQLHAQVYGHAQKTNEKNYLGQRAMRPQLDIGAITVSLGMNQDDAFQRLSGAGYKPEKQDPETWLIKAGGTSAQISFREGRLVYASREWLTGHTGELEAVTAALGSLSGGGPASCELSHHPFSAPSTNVQWTSLSCGERTLRVGVVRADGDQVRAVTESIGTL